MFGRVHKTFRLAGADTTDVPYIYKGRVKTVVVLQENVWDVPLSREREGIT